MYSILIQILEENKLFLRQNNKNKNKKWPQDSNLALYSVESLSYTRCQTFSLK